MKDALSATIRTLPDHLRRSLIWDRGKKMVEHARFTLDTGVRVYFCDPRIPRQPATNENSNGLLRQYFSKGTDLSGYNQARLDEIAAELNGRPRHTLGWRTPSEAFACAGRPPCAGVESGGCDDAFVDFSQLMILLSAP